MNVPSSIWDEALKIQATQGIKGHGAQKRFNFTTAIIYVKEKKSQNMTLKR